MIFIFFLPRKPTAEAIAEYTKKVDFLKGLIETEKLVSNLTFEFQLGKLQP
jgi:hypothetical protein